MAIEKLEKNNGTCQLMDAVENPIPFWATSHRDLGNLTHFGFQNPCRPDLDQSPLITSHHLANCYQATYRSDNQREPYQYCCCNHQAIPSKSNSTHWKTNI
jgi:hypothetical protein